MKSGVNFTNVLRAAFAPVDLHPTYWRTVQRVQRRSWADFLVLWTRRVGHRFVGETEWCKRRTTSAFALCASGLVKLTPGVNFINVLRTVFTLVDPESVKNTVKSSVSFYAFGIYERKNCT